MWVNLSISQSGGTRVRRTKGICLIWSRGRLLPPSLPCRVQGYRKAAWNHLQQADLLISYTPSRSLRSSSKNLLKIPMYNLKSYGGRSFALASAVLWNSLPQSLRDLQSVETFKRKLKKHLFLQPYMEH